ncbi:hypothetical protein ACH5RR_017923 [Cinchona calisaya]|uniref:Uncharacterized protein n=1 Tax=Cinchona calisaya TaxID=153742 RepID=A0ABD2ZKM8_9GENT
MLHDGGDGGVVGVTGMEEGLCGMLGRKEELRGEIRTVEEYGEEKIRVVVEGQLYIEHDTMSAYVNAANCYKKTSTKRVVS